MFNKSYRNNEDQFYFGLFFKNRFIVSIIFWKTQPKELVFNIKLHKMYTFSTLKE